MKFYAIVMCNNSEIYVCMTDIIPTACLLAYGLAYTSDI